MGKDDLKDAVIDELVTMDFEEAYAVDFFKKGRVRDIFQSKLDELDWDDIEKTVKDIKNL